MKIELEEINKLVFMFMCEINHPRILEGKSKKEFERFQKRIEEFAAAYSEALRKNEITPLLKKYAESFSKLKYRFENERQEDFNRIYDTKTLANKLKLNEKVIRSFINKEWLDHDYLPPLQIYSLEGIPVIKQGTRFLFHKESVYRFLSKNSIKYVNDIQIPCNYDRLPEYLKVDECAEKLKLENGRQFKRNYVDKYIKKDHKVLDGVEVLKIGSTVRIEQESFLRYVETLGGETAK